MVSLDQLSALVALNEAGSFTKAAKSLHKAQSAVTYAIKSLESELGLNLLDRTGYRAKFTPEGKAILKKAEQIIDRSGRLPDDLTSFVNVRFPKICRSAIKF